MRLLDRRHQDNRQIRLNRGKRRDGRLALLLFSHGRTRRRLETELQAGLRHHEWIANDNSGQAKLLSNAQVRR